MGCQEVELCPRLVVDYFEMTTSGPSPLEGRPREEYSAKCGGSKRFQPSWKSRLGQQFRNMVGRRMIPSKQP